MRKYDSYKTTKIEFLDEIPEHWEEKRMRFLGYLYGGLSGKSATDFNQLTNEDNKYFIPFTNIANNFRIDAERLQTVVISENENQNTVQKGDLFFLMSSENYDDVGKSAVLLDDLEETYLNSFCKGFRITKGNVVPEFLNYQLHSKQLRHNLLTGANGFTRINLKIDKVIDLLTALPAPEEQTTIASYLDRKTTEIDELIAAKKRLLELYEEEKTAIINELVTGKRVWDGNAWTEPVEVKDSGIEWLGKIPEHWEVKKLKYLSKMQGGFAFSSKDFIESGVQLIKIGNLYNNELRLERQPTFLPEDFLVSHPNWIISAGDILMSMTGTLGKRDYGFAILLKDPNEKYLLNQRVSKIHSVKGICTNLLIHILHSEYFLCNLFSQPTGTKQGNFSNEDVMNLAIAFPKEEKEQKDVLNFIEKEFKRINLKIENIKSLIDLLIEYKTALISEVVTGKIKVTE